METSIARKNERLVGKYYAMAHDVLQLPTKNVWIDYDKQADVLYVSFRKPQRATKTIEIGEDILVRKEGRTVAGVTIMNASAHK